MQQKDGRAFVSRRNIRLKVRRSPDSIRPWRTLALILFSVRLRILRRNYTPTQSKVAGERAGKCDNSPEGTQHAGVFNQWRWYTRDADPWGWPEFTKLTRWPIFRRDARRCEYRVLSKCSFAIDRDLKYAANGRSCEDEERERGRERDEDVGVGR